MNIPSLDSYKIAFTFASWKNEGGEWNLNGIKINAIMIAEYVPVIATITCNHSSQDQEFVVTLAKELIKHGADVNLNTICEDPLNVAVRKRNRKLIELLLQNNAKIKEHELHMDTKGRMKRWYTIPLKKEDAEYLKQVQANYILSEKIILLVSTQLLPIDVIGIIANLAFHFSYQSTSLPLNKNERYVNKLMDRPHLITKEERTHLQQLLNKKISIEMQCNIHNFLYADYTEPSK